MSDEILFAVGLAVFAITTLASLWAGYLLLQRAWVVQNPELKEDGDHIRPLFAKQYDIQEPTEERT